MRCDNTQQAAALLAIMTETGERSQEGLIFALYRRAKEAEALAAMLDQAAEEWASIARAKVWPSELPPPQCRYNSYDIGRMQTADTNPYKTTKERI